jgi:branched-chain amino acid transport system ATP-binding protein
VTDTKSGPTTTLLDVGDLAASYGGLKALHGVSLRVAAGEIVAVLGANGAGKSTLLKAIAGMVDIDAGTISLEGRDLRRLPAYEVARAGVSLVPEGRRLFPRLKVSDNLRLGAYARRRERQQDAGAEQQVFTLFPRLAERLEQRAETLSGGEQQMLAIGRALMNRPRLLMLDEPSQGIMPRLVDDILAAVAHIRAQGTTVLIVEQRVAECLEIADRVYVLQTGRIIAEGNARDLAADDRIRQAYLGL